MTCHASSRPTHHPRREAWLRRDVFASIFQDPRAPLPSLENSRSLSAASSPAAISLEISLRRFPSIRALVKAPHATARPPSFESAEATARRRDPPLRLRPQAPVVFQAIQLPYPCRHVDRRSPQ